MFKNDTDNKTDKARDGKLFLGAVAKKRQEPQLKSTQAFDSAVHASHGNIPYVHATITIT